MNEKWKTQSMKRKVLSTGFWGLKGPHSVVQIQAQKKLSSRFWLELAGYQTVPFIHGWEKDWYMEAEIVEMTFRCPKQGRIVVVSCLLAETSVVLVISFGNDQEGSRFFSDIRETRNDKICFHYLCMEVQSDH